MRLTAVARPAPDAGTRLRAFPRLAERKDQPGTQAFGRREQQMLAVARALVLNPKLLLLDERSRGFAPIIVEESLRAIGRITREEGLGHHRRAASARHPAHLRSRHRARPGQRGACRTAQELPDQPELLIDFGVVR